MPNRIPLEGTVIGYWSVLKFLGLNENRQTVYFCRCDCGTEREVVAQTLREGKSVSCGCQKASLIAKARTKHGRAGSSAYQVWRDMVYRCTNPKAQRWLHYGGRGIKVCDEWMVFENWNRDMGDPPPGFTLERIDNNGDYEKSNCKWATVQEQNQNTRLDRDVVTGRFKSPNAS